MGNVDEKFGSLPGVLALQVGDTVLRNDEVGGRSRCGYDAALGKHRLDKGFQTAVLSPSGSQGGN